MYNFKEIYHTVLKEYPDIMTVYEMSKALGISSKTGYKLIKEGVIKSRKVGRAYRIASVPLLNLVKYAYIPVIFGGACRRTIITYKMSCGSRL